VAHYALLEMAGRTVGPRRTDSHRTYVRGTRIIAGLTVLILSGAIVWDLVNDGFWSRHALFTSLVASLIIVAMTAAGLNELLQRRRRERWSVLAQYALFEFVRTARLVWDARGPGARGRLRGGARHAASRRGDRRHSRERRAPRTAPPPDRWAARSRPGAARTLGPVEDESLCENLVAIAQLAESLDRGSFELAIRIVPLDWWTAQLPDRPATAENLPA
jgi:hypothetical protein